MKTMIHLLTAFFFVLILFTDKINAQSIAINSDGSPAAASAILDVTSTSKGLLIPRMNSSQRDLITTPVQALQIYNTTSNCYEAYNGSSWQTVSCICTGAPASPGTISSTTAACSMAFSIAAVSGATTYTWTVPAGASIISGQGTISITANFGTATGNVTVTAGNGCGTSSASTLSVNTNNTNPGAAGSITGLSAVCLSQTGVNYQIAAVSGATSYTWTVPPGATITNTGVVTNSINVKAPAGSPRSNSRASIGSYISA